MPAVPPARVQRPIRRLSWFRVAISSALPAGATAAGATAAVGLTPRLLEALQQGKLIKRAIPSTGEMLPVIGLGSSATFATVAGTNDERNALKQVFQAMSENGATLFDTAPGYGGGASEEVAGKIVNELGLADKMFWATKVNAAGRGSSTADPAATRAQIERSFDIIRKKTD